MLLLCRWELSMAAQKTSVGNKLNTAPNLNNTFDTGHL